MQFVKAVVLFIFTACGAEAQSMLPVHKVTGILKSLRVDIESEGKTDQMYYDKMACWVEETTAAKRKAIEDGEKKIKQLSEEILKLSADIGTNEAAVKNLEQDIKDNEEAQKEADELREKEHKAYMAEFKETDACIGALKAVAKFLNKTSGAGKEKEGFLQHPQVLSVAGRLRRVLTNSAALRGLSDEDLQDLRQFINQPRNSKGRQGVLSAAQVDGTDEAPNPFGDYAPRSDRIQGILSEMMHTFGKDAKEARDKEDEAQKAYDEMTSTRKAELKTLKTTFQTTSEQLASDKVSIAEDREVREETKKQVADDKALLAQILADAKERAALWSNRCRLRTEELMGIDKAIEILTSPEALAVFRNVSSAMPGPPPVSFLEVASISSQQSMQQAELARKRGYTALKALASRYGNMQIAKLAAKLQVTGHFDAVIASCNEMMALLRAEEAADIEHRDRCQSGQNANANSLSDLNSSITKQDQESKMLGMSIDELQQEIMEREATIRGIKREMETMLDERNAEHAEFKQAVLDHKLMMGLLSKAMAALAKYYEKNDIELKLLQGGNGTGPPVYSIDPDKMPETPWVKKDAHASGTHGILEIMAMIKEDTEKQLGTVKTDEEVAEAAYEKSKAGLEGEIKDEEAMIALAEKTKADKMEEQVAADKEKAMREADQKAQEGIQETLEKDCDWVEKNFDSRYKKRKAEMDGITQAIAYLSGIQHS